MKLVFPKLSKPWIPVVFERVQPEVVIVERFDVRRVDSNGNRTGRLQLILADDVLSVGPAVASDNQKSPGEIQVLYSNQQLSDRYPFAEAHNHVGFIVHL